MNARQSVASQAERSFMIERTFAAPIERVFRLWTDPLRVAQWWGIKDCTIPYCALDVRVGGRWRIDMRTASGALYRNEGQYVDVVANCRLSYTDEPDPELREWAGKPPGQSLHTVTFETDGARTRVCFDVMLASAADRERLLALGVREGWMQSFDRLERAISRLATPQDPARPAPERRADQKSIETVVECPMQQAVQTPRDRDAPRAGSTLSAAAPGTQTAISADGTPIAYERRGKGQPLIIVDGALCSRGMGPSRPLATALAEHFTVFSYDRRSRGESGNTMPYAVEREVDDIEAVLDAAGGEAFVWGTSSGAMLALTAAERLPGVRKLALYEAPLIVDDSRPATVSDWDGIRTAVAAERPGDALRIFLKSVGMPRPLVFLMRLTPIWSKLKAVAHTLPYDGAIVAKDQLGKPLVPGRWTAMKAPTLVTDGGRSPSWMRHGNKALTDALPNARYLTLPGQNHMVKPNAHVPVLVDFFYGA